LKIYPQYKLALVGLGAAVGTLGKHFEALKTFENALKIDPNNDKALRNKGLSLIQL